MNPRFAALMVVLTACSTGGGPAGVTPLSAGRGHGRSMAPVRIEPAPPVSYVFYRLDSITTRLPDGTETPQVIGRTLLITVSITPPPPGTTGDPHIAIHLDSVAVDPDAPEIARAPFVGMAGTTWNGTVSAAGTISDLTPDHRSAGAEAATPDLERWLPILPAAGVEVGDTWTDTLTSSYPFSNLDLQVAETLIAGWTATAGSAAATLDLESAGTLTRSGSSSVVTLLGSGTRSARYTLDTTGILMAADGADSMLMKLSVNAVGQSVVVGQVGHFSVTRRP
ncbi:MAG: hypothetical protein ACREL2_09265 [Gemmatimonadales bacterium]